MSLAPSAIGEANTSNANSVKASTSNANTMTANFRPRRMEFSFPDEMPEDWMAGNTFLTHFFTAFAAQFPQGERFLIESVRLFQKQVEPGSQLSKEVRAFIGQEAHHANAHEALNVFLGGRGAPTAAIDQQTAKTLALLKRVLTNKQQMAMTAGLEHFTSMFGDLMLANPDLMDSVHPGMRPMFLWHAIEETEHKAVTFDLYQAVDGNYKRRVLMYFIATALLASFTAAAQARLTLQQPAALKPKSLFGGLNWMFGFGKQAGYVRKMLPDYLDYLRPSFHPWDLDNTALLEKWQGEFAQVEQEFSYKKAA